MIQKAELINEFSQRAAENKAAYFIGAGISIPVNWQRDGLTLRSSPITISLKLHNIS